MQAGLHGPVGLCTCINSGGQGIESQRHHLFWTIEKTEGHEWLKTETENENESVLRTALWQGQKLDPNISCLVDSNRWRGLIKYYGLLTRSIYWTLYKKLLTLFSSLICPVFVSLNYWFICPRECSGFYWFFDSKDIFTAFMTSNTMLKTKKTNQNKEKLSKKRQQQLENLTYERENWKTIK